MYLYAEATHIYKPGNKDEVRLVYRVRGGGESNRHQKSFSIGKYGIKECWRMATESKNFINTTHRLPHDFLDPWASLKNLQSSTNSSVYHPNDTNTSKHAINYEINNNHATPIGVNASDPDELMEKKVITDDTSDSSNRKVLKPIDTIRKRLKKQLNSTAEVCLSNTQTQTVQLPEKRKSGCRITNTMAGENLIPNEYKETRTLIGGSISKFQVINKNTNSDSTLCMQLKKKRGRPPKWLRTFSPTELNKMFKVKKDQRSKLTDLKIEEQVGFSLDNEIQVKQCDSSIYTSEANLSRNQNEKVPYSEILSFGTTHLEAATSHTQHTRNTNALIASGRVDWNAAKTVFEGFSLISKELVN